MGDSYKRIEKKDHTNRPLLGILKNIYVFRTRPLACLNRVEKSEVLRSCLVLKISLGSEPNFGLIWDLLNKFPIFTNFALKISSITKHL